MKESNSKAVRDKERPRNPVVSFDKLEQTYQNLRDKAYPLFEEHNKVDTELQQHIAVNQHEQIIPLLCEKMRLLHQVSGLSSEFQSFIDTTNKYKGNRISDAVRMRQKVFQWLTAIKENMDWFVDYFNAQNPAFQKEISQRFPAEVHDLLPDERNEHNKRGRGEDLTQENRILAKIDVFDRAWDTLSAEIYAKELELYQQAIGILGNLFYEPFNHLYVKQLQLLHTQGPVIHEIYALNRQMSSALREHITFIHEQMEELVDFYTENSDDFREDIQRRLQKNPELLEWIMPFLNREEGVEPLEQAVYCLMKRQKMDEVEALAEVYEIQVERQLPLIKAHIQKHLDAITEFEEKLQQNPHRPYAQKVQLYADYCASTFKSILDTLSALQGPLRVVDDCLEQFCDISVKQRMGEVKNLLSRMRTELIIEVETLFGVMDKLASQYRAHEKNLCGSLKRFMAPWVESHDSPLSESIQAYEASLMPTEIVVKVASAESSTQDPTCQINPTCQTK